MSLEARWEITAVRNMLYLEMMVYEEMVDFLYAHLNKRHSLILTAAQPSSNAFLEEECFARVYNFICKLSKCKFQHGSPASSTERARIILKAVFISHKSYRETNFSITVAGFFSKLETLVLSLKLFNDNGKYS